MTTKQQMIMTTLSKIPIVSTDMIYTYFQDNGSPQKRASENLRVLWNQKLVEKQPRSTGQTSLWRLSKKGRDYMNTSLRPYPFHYPKVEHILEIGKCYQWLEANGDLQEFIYEPKYHIKDKMEYYPDAFFIWNNRAYMLEVQRSYLSVDRWQRKWKVAEEFFKGPFKKASFQTNPAKIIKPRILCLAAGNPTLLEGLNITVIRSIEQMEEI